MTASAWSKEDSQTAQRLNQEGWSRRQIGDLLGRTPDAVGGHLDRVSGRRAMLEAQRKAEPPKATDPRTIPPEVLDAREQYLCAPRTLSSVLLGDPPEGYSALDRRAR